MTPGRTRLKHEESDIIAWMTFYSGNLNGNMRTLAVSFRSSYSIISCNQTREKENKLESLISLNETILIELENLFDDCHDRFTVK